MAATLPWSRVVGYGAGDAGCNVAFQMTGLFLLLYYTDVVGLSAASAGSIFLFVKFWDAFADIFAGRMVDKTMTRWGKFRPFILWFSLPLLAMNLACFAIPEFTSMGARLAWGYVSYALLGLLYSLVNIPFGSLAGAMTQDPIERSKLAGARMVGSGFTILILAIWLAPQVKKSADLHGTFLLTATVFVFVGMAFFMFTFFTAKETVFREVPKVGLKDTLNTVRHNGPLARLCGSSLMYLTGQNVVSALAIFYARDYLHGSGTLLAIATIVTTGAVLYVGPFGPWVTRTLGKKRGFLIGCIGSIVGGVIVWLGKTNVPIAMIGLAVIGICMALLNTMTWALEADTVEYGEWQTGIRTEGATYAAFSFTRKVGQAVGAGLAGYALGVYGYVSATKGVVPVQAQHTLDGIMLTMAFLPAIFFALAAIVMASYPLTETMHAKLVREINERRSQGLTAGHLSSASEPSA